MKGVLMAIPAHIMRLVDKLLITGSDEDERLAEIKREFEAEAAKVTDELEPLFFTNSSQAQ
jgi:hypothetical protein